MPDCGDSQQEQPQLSHSNESANRSQLIEFQDMLVAIRGKVSQVCSPKRRLRQNLQPLFDAAWGGGLISPAEFTELVYGGRMSMLRSV
jgi:hypothetical protein